MIDPKQPKYRSVGTVLTAGVANTIYTCPPNQVAKVGLLFIANSGSGNKTVSIQWYDSVTTTLYHIVGGYVISAYNYLKLDGSYLILNANDYLVATPEAGSTMDATVSIEEYFNPLTGR